MFVMAFGIGAIPGFLALALHTIGSLTKLFYESIESHQLLTDAARAYQPEDGGGAEINFQPHKAVGEKGYRCWIRYPAGCAAV
jgi:hypothetical protein